MLLESPSASIQKAVETLFQDYTSDGRAHRIGKRFVPSREEIFAIVQLLLELSYPGFYGQDDLAEEHLEGHLAVVVSTLHERLSRQIEACLRHDEETEGSGPDSRPPHRTGGELAGEFLRRLPLVRRRLVLDVEAAYDGDPAAASVDEVILAYPGLLAITVHRLAHELYRMGVPLMPRIMAEWAHTRTGADIHPGATIGDRFFIDHATGVVIGETTVIGVRVKLYQGVTLGALSLPHAARGARGAKRHPTVEDDVTVYANATVLGGDTVLGRESVVGGGVFITKSVPPRTRVAIEAPRLRVAAPRAAGGDGAGAASATDPWSDFEI